MVLHFTATPHVNHCPRPNFPPIKIDLTNIPVKESNAMILDNAYFVENSAPKSPSNHRIYKSCFANPTVTSGPLIFLYPFGHFGRGFDGQSHKYRRWSRRSRMLTLQIASSYSMADPPLTFITLEADTAIKSNQCILSLFKSIAAKLYMQRITLLSWRT